MISDIPDGFFLIPDLIDATTDKVNSDITQADIDDRKIQDFYLATLPWSPRFFISEDDLPY